MIICNFRKYWGNIPPVEGKFPPPPLPVWAEHCRNLYKNYILSYYYKCFEFPNDWLKINRIWYKCTQFCAIPFC